MQNCRASTRDSRCIFNSIHLPVFFSYKKSLNFFLKIKLSIFLNIQNIGHFKYLVTLTTACCDVVKKYRFSILNLNSKFYFGFNSPIWFSYPLSVLSGNTGLNIWRHFWDFSWFYETCTYQFQFFLMILGSTVYRTLSIRHHNSYQETTFCLLIISFVKKSYELPPPEIFLLLQYIWSFFVQNLFQAFLWRLRNLEPVENLSEIGPQNSRWTFCDNDFTSCWRSSFEPFFVNEQVIQYSVLKKCLDSKS